MELVGSTVPRSVMMEGRSTKTPAMAFRQPSRIPGKPFASRTDFLLQSSSAMDGDERALRQKRGAWLARQGLGKLAAVELRDVAIE